MAEALHRATLDSLERERADHAEAVANMETLFEATSSRVLATSMTQFNETQERILRERDSKLKDSLGPLEELLGQYKLSLEGFDDQLCSCRRFRETKLKAGGKLPGRLVRRYWDAPGASAGQKSDICGLGRAVCPGAAAAQKRRGEDPGEVRQKGKKPFSRSQPSGMACRFRRALCKDADYAYDKQGEEEENDAP